jgi:hypothetical protein
MDHPHAGPGVSKPFGGAFADRLGGLLLLNVRHDRVDSCRLDMKDRPRIALSKNSA